MGNTVLNLHLRLVKWIRRTAERHQVPTWTPPALHRLVRRSHRALHRWYHYRLGKRSLSGRTANLGDVEAFVSGHAVRFDRPLVIISQIQRSGGSLLSQLFDTHPALAAYPHELKFGYAVKDRWPPVDPALGAERNFRLLFDLNFPRKVRRGFTKGDRNPIGHPFLLIPKVQFAVFKQMWRDAPPANAREILDHYFAAFFNGWLNYQGDLEQKRWITAFAPRLAHDEASMDRLFECYPGGRLIQIVRDPKSWYPSVRHHRQSGPGRKTLEFAASKWRASVQSMLRNRDRFGDRVIVLRFEDMVQRTEETMRALSDLLGIEYDPCLLEPTFNGRPMRANSSFAVDSAGVIDAPLTRSDQLTARERRAIDERCRDLFDEVLAICLDVDGRAFASRNARPHTRARN